MEWLEESEKSLDSDMEIANEPDKIKQQLLQHKVTSLKKKTPQKQFLQEKTCPTYLCYQKVPGLKPPIKSNTIQSGQAERHFMTIEAIYRS